MNVTITETVVKPLYRVLSEITGRKLAVGDIQTTLAMPKATYYAQIASGRLTEPTSLVRIAREFDLNPLDLLTAYGYVTRADIENWT